MNSKKQHKVIQFQENCIGCNACVLIAPSTWRIDSVNAKSELINGKKKGQVSVATLNDFEIEDNKKAAEACPMRIIKIE